MQYTIKAVSPQTRQYDTKFGPMVSYKVMFDELPDTAVEISQKSTTAAPAVGDSLTGSIDMSGQYGPKFKKEYNQGGFTPQGQSTERSTPTGSGKPSYDTFTMFLSYAKDIAVAQIAAGEMKGRDYTDLLDAVTVGGYQLYNARPGAEPAQTQLPVEEPKVDTSSLDAIFDVPAGEVTLETPWDTK